MSSWATKRRLTYFFLLAGLALIVIAIPLFKTLYVPATCLDKAQNQGEVGIDCGGPCQRLCPAEALPPIVHWQRFFEVVPTVYSAVAYVENPNIKAGASRVPYVFKFLNKNNDVIYERTGSINIPPKKIIAIFEHTVSIPLGKPTKVIFEFPGEPAWDKTFPEEPLIPVAEKELKDEGTAPLLFATIVNPFVYPLANVEVTALISDTKGNVIAVSQTFIDKIEKDSSRKAVFTWPKPFTTETKSCEVSADIALVIDRSGSMDDDGIDPVQPLTDVKDAAVSFVGKAKSGDQIGVVSFASVASNPPDSVLSSTFEAVKSSIRGITILQNGSQNTNIGDGLKKAGEELNSERHKGRSKKVMVLLTDGEANLPQADNSDTYPEDFAMEMADKAKKDDTEIYTIGLGNKVKSEFLKKVASVPSNYYEAVTSKDLQTVYGKISSSICKIGPSVIEIITRTNSR